MAREEERLYGVSAFHVGAKRYTPKNSVFNDKVEVFTDGYGVISDVSNRKKLFRLSIPDEIEGVSIDEIGPNAFKDCVNLEILMLAKSIERIDAHAFENCIKLRVAVFGDSVYEIGDSAFENCPDLENIYFSPSLEKIGSRAFYGCNSLRSVKLFGHAALGSMCFSSCKRLENVEFERIREIPDGAFLSSGLKRIRISNDVERIGISAFSRCTSLESITYDGTIDEFRKIFFGINWNKDIPSSCVLLLRDNRGKYYNAFEQKTEVTVECDDSLRKDLELLGVDSDRPTLSDITKCYRNKARKFHPDVLSGLDLDILYTEFASNKFRLYTEAYERLISYYKNK